VESLVVLSVFFFSIDACNPSLHHRKITPAPLHPKNLHLDNPRAGSGRLSTLDLETDASGPILKPASV
jgi:hypothetical protein